MPSDGIRTSRDFTLAPTFALAPDMAHGAPMANPDGADSARRRPLVRRLMLRDFRSYAALDLAIDGRLVVLCGENGAGKTNLLEALSLLSPGRGLRRAELAECARIDGAGGFALSVEVEEDGEKHQLGSGWNPPQGDASAERKNRIDRAPVSSSRAFSDHVRVVWLTPAMDTLFAGPASERRRFLDRFVLAIDPNHGVRVGQFERALRGRNRLLEERPSNASWLDAAEREAAELGVAIAAARLECVSRLQALIEAGRDDASPFPWARLALQGEVEALAASGPALKAEDRYRALLRDNRARDAAAGRTLIGPHLCELAVWHGPKDAPAASASTGEQKALLVGLVLAHARLVADMSGIVPLALLDEIAAHFDPRRRSALLEALTRLGGQVFLTGADPAAFADLERRAQMFEVSAQTGVKEKPSGVAGVR
jgi:DNA replication and repair protein RecF